MAAFVAKQMVGNKLNAVKEKKRQSKTLQDQFLIYVSFIEANPAITLKKDSDKATEGLWEKLKNLLNSGTGPQRTTQAWKKIFENWRNALRHKKRRLNVHLNGTGGGPELMEKLKDIEERALNAWGSIAIDGVCSMEAGLNSFPSDPPPVEECLEIRTEPVTHYSKTPEPVSKQSTRKRRKSSNDYEVLNKILKIEEQKTQARLDTESKIAEGLNEIAESLNNLAEAVFAAVLANPNK